MFDHHFALGPRCAAVHEKHIGMQSALQLVAQTIAHLAILSKDEYTLAVRDDFLEHLGQTLQLAGASRQRTRFVQVLSGMIAYLFQRGDERENMPAPLDTV